jgi:neurotransmitter:Na+ symporter, NSS family
VLAAIGSAVGLGNLVRFPRELSLEGGAAFLFIYLAVMLFVGYPALVAEMAIGKRAKASPIEAFKQQAKTNPRWRYAGAVGVVAVTFVLFWYTTIAGWALRFFLETFNGAWYAQPATHYDEIAYGRGALLFHGIVTLVTLAVVARGISKGIEKVNLYLIPALFAIVSGLAIYAAFQPGAGAGYSALLSPDWSEVDGRTVTRAMGQVFFSLSLGQGIMLTYASYMQRKQSVVKDGAIIAGSDLAVAVMAGLMIFPFLAIGGLLDSPEIAAGSYGTAFKAIPTAFTSMGATIGPIVGATFFLGLFFAALSSSISLMEVPVSVLSEKFGWTRAKTAILVGLVTYSFGVAAAVNQEWFLFYDELGVNLLVVMGAFLTTLFAGWYAKGIREELREGAPQRVTMPLMFAIRVIVPVALVIVFIVGGLFGNDGFWTEGAGLHDLTQTFLAALRGH